MHGRESRSLSLSGVGTVAAVCFAFWGWCCDCLSPSLSGMTAEPPQFLYLVMFPMSCFLLSGWCVDPATPYTSGCISSGGVCRVSDRARHLPIGAEFVVCELDMRPLLGPDANAAIRPVVQQRIAARRLRDKREHQRDLKVLYQLCMFA